MARILGLDVGKEAVRGTVLYSAFRKLEVERHVQIPLSPDADGAAAAVDLNQAIAGLLRVLGTPPDTVIAELPGELVSLRAVRLPRAAAKHIADVLPFEMESIIPFAPESAVIDYQNIETGPEELRLLVAAAPRERVVERLKQLRDSGTEPRSICAGAAALDGLCRLIPELGQGGPYLLVNLEAETTDLCIIGDGRCQLARTLSLGLSRLPSGPDELWRGIQRSVASFRAAGGSPVQRVFASGAGATQQEAIAWLAERLGTRVDPLPLPAPPGRGEVAEPVFARSTALAAQGLGGGKSIDLRQGDLAPVRAASALLRHSGLLGGCLLAILLCALFAIYGRRALLVNERDALRTRLASVTKELFGEAASDVEQAQRLLVSQRSGDPLPRFDAFDALNVVSGSISPEVTHDVRRLRIEVGDDKHDGVIELQGSLSTIEQRDEVAEALAKHPCFGEVKKGKTSPAREANRINYQLETSIRCPGDAPKSKKSIRGGGSRE
jgi:general secretion pathway protein L